MITKISNVSFNGVNSYQNQIANLTKKSTPQLKKELATQMVAAPFILFLNFGKIIKLLKALALK